MDHYPETGWIRRLFRIDLKAEAVVNLDDVVGEIDPRIYGHFAGCLENGLYDGSEQNQDVTALLDALHPAMIRFSVGKFDSEVNKSALDAALAFCEAVGAALYLTVDSRSATPEDAANWVTYYNGTAYGERNGLRLEPGKVALWGLGNGISEGEQVECSNADEYIQRLRPFFAAMRKVDPEIQLAAAGMAMLPGDLQDAEDWTRTVLAGIGDQIDFLSLQIYQPDEAGQEEYRDPEQWYHSILSAPHSAEETIERMGRLIREAVPEREIGIALDAFSVRLPGDYDSQIESDSAYTLRDGLYVAGMLNVFQRQCEVLKIANVLPLIVNVEGQPAFATPLYFPYLLYSRMESQLLSLAYWSPVFKAEALGGNISERNQVPYIDITATRSPDGKWVVLGITNRNPQRQAKVMVNLKGEGKRKFRVVEAQLISGPDPLAANTADAPNAVSVQSVRPPRLRFTWLDVDLPPASLIVVALEEKG